MWQTRGWHIVYPLVGLGLIIGASLSATLAVGWYGPLLLATLGGLIMGLWLAKIRPALFSASPELVELPSEHPHIASVLGRLTRIINATLELNQVLNLSLEQLAEVLPYEAAFVLLADAQGLTIAAMRGQPQLEHLINTFLTLDEADPIAAVMRERRPRVIADVQALTDWQPFYGQAAAHVARAWLGTPLVVQDESIGILIFERQTPGFCDTKNVDLVTTLAAQIATAVQNARYFNDLRHRALEVAVMADNLNEEKSKLDAILSHIADGLVVTDADGNIQLVNPAFEQMFNRPNTTLADGLTTHIEELQRLITNALADQETSVTDISLSDGRILQASSGVIEEETRTLGVVTVLRDITREKEVDRMKSEFISTVSHELRTPLTSVLGFAKHINKIFNKNIAPKISADDNKAQRTVQHVNEELDIILAEGERLTRLINDVLDIAKMEAGKLEWHMAEVLLTEVIEQAKTSTSLLAEIKHLPVESELDEQLPTIWGDKDRLIQVVTNLLSNAIKFTDEGGVKIRTRQLVISEYGTITPLNLKPLNKQYTNLLQPGHWLLTSVQDTGIGISEENLPYVFEKFKQVGDVLTDRPAGTGLGIPICKEIIEQHGGRIWADSELGVGSTFTFALPIAPAGRLKAGSPLSHIPVSAIGGTEGRQEQLILIVDDEKNIRNLLRQELSEAGYQVIEASNGLDALTKARQIRPDLIILDVMMPGLNGFDVTSVLKGDEITAHIPVLILSIVEDRERGFRLGAEDYLTKPLEMDQLLQSIANLLVPREAGHKSVLIIDKEAVMDMRTVALLEEKGYSVIKLADEQEGLQKAKQARPDFIILNTSTSKRDDNELLKSLRGEADIRHAPIIVLTNTVSPEEVAQMLDHGITEEDQAK